MTFFGHKFPCSIEMCNDMAHDYMTMILIGIMIAITTVVAVKKLYGKVSAKNILDWFF